MKMCGEWIVVEGLVFRDGTTGGKAAVIEYRLGKEAANNCRITNCVIDSFNPKVRNIAYPYVALYGRHNRFDNNSLLNKLNLGVTVVVMLDQERDQQNFHRIDHNYFGPRPVYGSNGAETMRVGTSVQAMTSSFTTIEQNYFDRCSGEVEIVSIKSCDNTIARNVFFESQGVVALRHGERNKVLENLFIGNNVRNTGGVRVINADQTVVDNIFYRLAGDRFFSALAVMNAVPNSLPNRYCQVERAKISRNVFFECARIEFGTGKDAERTLEPVKVTFSNNVIYNPKAKTPFENISSVAGFTFADNSVKLAAGAVLEAGFKESKMNFYKVDGLDIASVRPLTDFPVIKSAECGASYQMQGNDRPELAIAPMIFAVKAGQDELLKAVAEARRNDIVELTTEGEYPISKSLIIDKKITIRAASGLKSRPIVRYNANGSGNIVTLNDGAELTIEGIAFNGAGEPGKTTPSAGISTANGMIQPYLLTVDNCEFYDFPEGSTVPIRGLANTFSELVVIKNSLFRAISADAINFAAERADMGVYNAEEIVIENCSFNRILGVAINIYRGGSDESTAGPIVKISGCTFEDVCNKERGSVLRLIGGQVMDIENCNFSNSGRGGASIRLDEATWEKINVVNCNFFNSGRILTMTGKVTRGQMLNVKPAYIDAAKYDYRTAKGSVLNQKSIGVK